MAVCETTHWILDCGEGHGCGFAEFSDIGELAGWFCGSELVKGRRRPRENEATYRAFSATATLDEIIEGVGLSLRA